LGRREECLEKKGKGALQPLKGKSPPLAERGGGTGLGGRGGGKKGGISAHPNQGHPLGRGSSKTKERVKKKKGQAAGTIKIYSSAVKVPELPE